MPRISSRSSASEASACALASAVNPAAWLVGSSSTSRAPSRESSATSCCWTPSWRSRSSRRRTDCSASTSRRRDERSSSTWTASSSASSTPCTARAAWRASSRTCATSASDQPPCRGPHSRVPIVGARTFEGYGERGRSVHAEPARATTPLSRDICTQDTSSPAATVSTVRWATWTGVADSSVSTRWRTSAWPRTLPAGEPAVDQPLQPGAQGTAGQRGEDDHQDGGRVAEARPRRLPPHRPRSPGRRPLPGRACGRRTRRRPSTGSAPGPPAARTGSRRRRPRRPATRGRPAAGSRPPARPAASARAGPRPRSPR